MYVWIYIYIYKCVLSARGIHTHKMIEATGTFAVIVYRFVGDRKWRRWIHSGYDARQCSKFKTLLIKKKPNKISAKRTTPHTTKNVQRVLYFSWVTICNPWGLWPKKACSLIGRQFQYIYYLWLNITFSVYCFWIHFFYAGTNWD